MLYGGLRVLDRPHSTRRSCFVVGVNVWAIVCVGVAGRGFCPYSEACAHPLTGDPLSVFFFFLLSPRGWLQRSLQVYVYYRYCRSLSGLPRPVAVGWSPFGTEPDRLQSASASASAVAAAAVVRMHPTIGLTYRVPCFGTTPVSRVTPLPPARASLTTRLDPFFLFPFSFLLFAFFHVLYE